MISDGTRRDGGITPATERDWNFKILAGWEYFSEFQRDGITSPVPIPSRLCFQIDYVSVEKPA